MELLSTIAMIVATSSALLLPPPRHSLPHAVLSLTFLSQEFPSDLLSCMLGTTGTKESTMPYLEARWRMAFPFCPPDSEAAHVGGSAA